MAVEQSVSVRAAMGIVAIPPMVGKPWVAMVASQSKGSVRGMQYENFHCQLVGMIELV